MGLRPYILYTMSMHWCLSSLVYTIQRYSRSPSPTELDSLLMSSPEDDPPHPPSRGHHRHRHHESHASTSTKTRGAETTGQRRSGTHRSSKSYNFTSHTHVPNERTSLSLRDLEQRNSANVNPLAHRSSQLRSTPAYSTTRHSSGTSASTHLDAPVHPVIGRSGGGKSEAGEGGRGERASAHAWSEELFSGGVPESGFHPKLTSSLTALKVSRVSLLPRPCPAFHMGEPGEEAWVG